MIIDKVVLARISGLAMFKTKVRPRSRRQGEGQAVGSGRPWSGYQLQTRWAHSLRPWRATGRGRPVVAFADVRKSGEGRGSAEDETVRQERDEVRDRLANTQLVSQAAASRPWRRWSRRLFSSAREGIRPISDQIGWRDNDGALKKQTTHGSGVLRAPARREGGFKTADAAFVQGRRNSANARLMASPLQPRICTR